MMKTIQTAFILISLCLSTTSFAAQPTNKDAVKQAALDACLAKAKVRYGSVSKNSRPKKKKLGNSRGYSYALRVGDHNKRIICHADANGETKFYSGNL